MKKNIISLFVVGSLLTIGYQVGAQSAAKPKKIIYSGTAFLNDGVTHQGEILKSTFDSLIMKPIVVIDSNGNASKIISFDFYYAERNLYEDSTGKPIILTDYSNEFCSGNMISKSLKDNLLTMTKWGDTAYIENVIYEYTDPKTKKVQSTHAKPIKLVIVNPKK